MKKIFLTLPVFILITTLVLSCHKKTQTVEDKSPAPAPTPVVDPYTYNTELQSSEDISLATFAVSDIDMMCGFIGEGIFSSYFDAEVPGTNTMLTIRDTGTKMLTISFNKTKCKDGKSRDGSIIMDYSYSTSSYAKHYRDFGFVARLIFNQYVVDGWFIELYDVNKPAFISNKLSLSNYDPLWTNITWEINGKFRFTNLADSSRTIFWDGKITKTLANTSNPSVFATNKQSPINWSLALVQYTGTVTAVTSGTVPGNYVIDSSNPVTRNFTCTYTPPTIINVIQFHPFVSGVATFTTSNFHPRTINYGPQEACDNKAEISILGEVFQVDFD